MIAERRSLSSRQARDRSILRFPFEDPMRVEVRVEGVRGLSLFEPEIPVGDELVVREAAQVEVLLAQELVARPAHGSPPGLGANGRVHLGAIA